MLCSDDERKETFPLIENGGCETPIMNCGMKKTKGKGIAPELFLVRNSIN